MWAFVVLGVIGVAALIARIAYVAGHVEGWMDGLTDGRSLQRWQDAMRLDGPHDWDQAGDGL